jgi:4-alpha-glucanotransferase
MRTSGILLPVSSIPSPYGIGNLGKKAYEFIDFLHESGQSYWQILPVGPTGCGDSPYQSFSAFAANPYLIDPDVLAEQGFLQKGEIESFDFGDDPERIDYGALFARRFKLLKLAADRFPVSDADFERFCSKNNGWLEDYALFMTLKNEHNMVSFQKWPDDLRLRRPSALSEARKRLAPEMRFWKITQYWFYSQWSALKDYAHQNGISIIGDIPIYVSPDSADLWAHSELFQVDENKRPIDVAGCPPDAFTSDGQLWGNPLYDWDAHAATGYRWWVERLASAAKIYDVVRIDHFRGFAGYYAIPAGSKNAKNGVWRKGPGIALINTLKKNLPRLSIIAEDLGFLTDDVRQLLAESGFPGMKVLQFAFNSYEKNDYLPHNHCRNCVVYTGTHDNTTTKAWQEALPADAAFARRYLGIGADGDLTRAIVRAAQSSVAETCIIPIQDYMGLGSEARINTPGTVGETGAGVWTPLPSPMSLPSRFVR